MPPRAAARRFARAIAIATCALAGVAAAQIPSPESVEGATVSLGVVHRRLVEEADNGDRLVKESGPLLALRLERRWHVGEAGALQVEAALTGGRLDYAGQTQAGVPVRSETRHRELEAALAWRPLAAGTWGEAWVQLRGLQQERKIAGVAGAGGLRETSTLWMPGVRWQHALRAGGWRLQPSLELRASLRHDLDIDYGGAYDDSDLKGGRRRDIALALAAAQGGSPWQWSATWTHSRQQASPTQTLYRGGVAVGNVRQPRIRIDDIGVHARRSF